VDKQGNVFSQFGEDKVIEEVLSTLKSRTSLDKWACEFGAWDGLNLSNTANLIINFGYSAVLIEANSIKFQDLKQNMQPYPVECINAFVNLEGANTLDNLLSKTDIPTDFDVLSIDIDGADYWILEGLKKYAPKVIVIEFNPTIPKEIEFINARDMSRNQGSSLRSLAKLAESKNYKVVGITICNIILIKNEYKDAFSEKIITLDNLPDPAYVNRIWQTFDGQIHTESELLLLWHNIHVPNQSIQALPKAFIMFPDNMNKLKSILFSVWKRYRNKRAPDE
jgi:Methyltransferase FkbM domain